MKSPFPDAALRYEIFRKEIFSAGLSVVRSAYLPFGDELTLQAQWFGGEFGRSFSGTEGESIEIVQFGHWNRGSGPDFTETAVQINGELKRGTIEIDLTVKNWEIHGHGSNPDFNEVVLHVFPDQPAMKRYFTRTESGRNVPQLLLPHYTGLEGAPDFLPEAFPGRCLAPLSRMTDEEVDSLLAAASQYRLRRKSERLQIMVRSTSPDQAMFQALAEALGFRRNKTAMAILAQRCPIGDLVEMESSAREARLFGAAGFLDPLTCEAIPAEQSRAYLNHLWDDWWKMRDQVESSPRRSIQWRYDGSRPLNHPHRRVGALAALVNQWESLKGLWEENVNNLEKEGNNLLQTISHPFWDRHFTLRSEGIAKAQRLIGKDRLRDILGNVIFPGAIREEPQQWEQYARLGKVDSNQKLRRAILRLFGRDSARQKLFTRYYHQQQGVLQIYDDFCLEDASECQNCPFPEQLTQWRAHSKPDEAVPFLKLQQTAG